MAAGSVAAKSLSGDILVRLSDDAEARLELRSASGDVNCGRRGAPDARLTVEAGTKAGSISIQ